MKYLLISIVGILSGIFGFVFLPQTHAAETAPVAVHTSNPDYFFCGLKPDSLSKNDVYYYTLGKSELLAMDSICLQSGSRLLEVVRFTMISLPKAGYMEEISFRGNLLNAVVRSWIGRMQAGDMLVFDNIRVKNAQGTETRLLPIAVVLR